MFLSEGGWLPLGGNVFNGSQRYLQQPLARHVSPPRGVSTLPSTELGFCPINPPTTPPTWQIRIELGNNLFENNKNICIIFKKLFFWNKIKDEQ